jgi:hypothetical protein
MKTCGGAPIFEDNYMYYYDLHGLHHTPSPKHTSTIGNLFYGNERSSMYSIIFHAKFLATSMHYRKIREWNILRVNLYKNFMKIFELPTLLF